MKKILLGSAVLIGLVACFAFFVLKVRIRPGYYPPLIHAVQKGDLEEASRLLAQGQDINQTTVGNMTAVHVAALEGNDDAMAWLIAHEANFLAKDQKGLTAYDLALEKGHESTAKLIRDAALFFQSAYDALSRRDLDGLEKILENDPRRYSALHYFAQVGDVEAVEELIARKKNPNARTIAGITPLMQAAALGYSSIVSRLLAAGAEVNAVDVWRDTALLAAAGGGHEDTVSILLKAGADPTIRSVMAGGTAAEFAEKNGHAQIARQLRDAASGPR
jgi:ankyrin repeat protein